MVSNRNNLSALPPGGSRVTSVRRDRNNPFGSGRDLANEMMEHVELPTSEPEIEAVAQQASIVLHDSGELDLGGVVLTPTGIVFGRQIEEHEWYTLGKLIGRLNMAMQWYIGDLLIEGERVWGKTYKDVAEVMGYDVDSLYNIVSTINKINFSLRNEKLNFEHYVTVQYLNHAEQEKWLRIAYNDGVNIMSAKRLGLAIKGVVAPTLSPPKGTPENDFERFSTFASQNKTKIQRFAKKLNSIGQGERMQISQLIDEQIRELQALKRNIGG